MQKAPSKIVYASISFYIKTHSAVIMAEKPKIIAIAIVEIMGKPPEHIEKTLKMYVEKLRKEKKDIKILEEDYAPAEEKKDNIFVTFVELKLEFKDISDVVWFGIDYMPASIEILEPDHFQYSSRDFTHFLNDMQMKHHKVDMIVKQLNAENDKLKRNALNLMRNLIRIMLKDGPKPLAEMAKVAGTSVQSMERFAESMLKEGKLKKDKLMYSLK